MKIWVNTIVFNEENFLWYAVKSVIDYVDKILIWDTGSSDLTWQIMKKLKEEYPGKVAIRQVGRVNSIKHTQQRQKMLEQSQCDWIILLDGDEVWWQASIKKLVGTIKDRSQDVNAIVVPFYNTVGDIYHHQSKLAGEYELLGRKGHLTIRAINRRIPGLHVDKPYGQEGYFDDQNRLIQESSFSKLVLINTPFLHLTHLKRSSQRRDMNKFKYDLGIPFPKNWIFPEVFNQIAPFNIPSPLQKRNLNYQLIAMLKFPFIEVYRRVRKLR